MDPCCRRARPANGARAHLQVCYQRRSYQTGPSQTLRLVIILLPRIYPTRIRVAPSKMVHHSLRMLLKQTTKTVTKCPPHSARLQRYLLSTHNPINQLLPLPLRTPQENQLPPHLRSTEVQRKEHCACLLQDQATSLVSCKQVQQVSCQQGQLHRWATQQLAHGPSTTQLPRGILGPRPSLVHRLVAQLYFHYGGCQQDCLCPSNMVAHRLAQVIPDTLPSLLSKVRGCDGALLYAMLAVRHG